MHIISHILLSVYTIYTHALFTNASCFTLYSICFTATAACPTAQQQQQQQQAGVFTTCMVQLFTWHLESWNKLWISSNTTANDNDDAGSTLLLFYLYSEQLVLLLLVSVPLSRRCYPSTSTNE
jgi:hypothetical protein